MRAKKFQKLLAERECSGISRLGVLIFVLIIASCVFVGYQVFPFYYYYYELEGLMQAQADKASMFTDEEIRRTLLEKIAKLEIPLDDPDQLKINRFDGKIIIDYSYEEVLYIDLGEKTYDLYVFPFHPHAERVIGKN
ncbi:MAG: hypothetical protein U0136_14575 [Bdellovibrionota bacterium]